MVIVGSGLNGTVGTGPAAVLSFGDGTTVSNVQRDAQRIRAVVTVAPAAAPGMRVVSTGGAAGRLAVYAQIDQIDVVPGYGIARVGGGRVAPVTAQFEAMASTRLPGGGLLELGPVAAEWSSIPFDAEAKRTEDDKFAGHFDMRGRFPAECGRPESGARVLGQQCGQSHGGGACRRRRPHGGGPRAFVVTVQRWITPLSIEGHANHKRTSGVEFLEWASGARAR